MTRRFSSLRITAAQGLALCTAAAGLLHAGTATASDSGLKLGGALSLTSDYVYRGLSQTDGHPALQGGVNLRSESGWSGGLWASNVDRGSGPGAQLEIDVQLSKAWALNQDWSVLVSANHYYYPDDHPKQPYEYDELVTSLSYQSRYTATVSWSPNTGRYSRELFVQNRAALSYELTAVQPLAPNWSFYAGLGHYDLSKLFGASYWYGSAGLSYSVGNLQMDLSYIAADHTAARLFDYEVSKRRWIGALSWRF